MSSKNVSLKIVYYNDEGEVFPNANYTPWYLFDNKKYSHQVFIS